MSKKTTVTEKFDENGKLLERVTVTEETDSYTHVPYYPYVPSIQPPVPFYQPYTITWTNDRGNAS